MGAVAVSTAAAAEAAVLATEAAVAEAVIRAVAVDLEVGRIRRAQACTTCG